MLRRSGGRQVLLLASAHGRTVEEEAETTTPPPQHGCSWRPPHSRPSALFAGAANAKPVDIDALGERRGDYAGGPAADDPLPEPRHRRHESLYSGKTRRASTRRSSITTRRRAVDRHARSERRLGATRVRLPSPDHGRLGADPVSGHGHAPGATGGLSSTGRPSGSGQAWPRRSQPRSRARPDDASARRWPPVDRRPRGRTGRGGSPASADRRPGRFARGARDRRRPPLRPEYGGAGRRKAGLDEQAGLARRPAGRRIARPRGGARDRPAPTRRAPDRRPEPRGVRRERKQRTSSALCVQHRLAAEQDDLALATRAAREAARRGQAGRRRTAGRSAGRTSGASSATSRSSRRRSTAPGANCAPPRPTKYLRRHEPTVSSAFNSPYTARSPWNPPRVRRRASRCPGARAATPRAPGARPPPRARRAVPRATSALPSRPRRRRAREAAWPACRRDVATRVARSGAQASFVTSPFQTSSQRTGSASDASARAAPRTRSARTLAVRASAARSAGRAPGLRAAPPPRAA